MDLEYRLRRLEAENERLKRAVEELSVLNDVALAVSSTATVGEVVELIVQKCVKHLKAEQGAVLLLDAEQQAGAPLRTMVRKVRTDYAGIPFRLGDQITGWMLKNQQPLLIADLHSDSRFRLPPEAAGVRSLLCVPMRLKGRMLGVLVVFNKARGETFTEGDLRLLTIIAAQSAQVIENARLYEEEQALARIEQELETAREIQRRLLPKRPPELPGFEIAGRSEPARTVGGDYFDYISGADGETALCVADVSGKGVTAALVMAHIQAAVRSQAIVGGEPAQQIARVNRLLHDSTEANKFVTMFYGLLDPERRSLTYVNAGHNPPALYRRGAEPQRLEPGGPVLGVLPRYEFQQASLALEPGDLLVVYTDGVSEAMNMSLDEYGERRLDELIRSNLDLSPAALIEAVFNDVKTFCGDAPQSDDMTMVVVRRVD